METSGVARRGWTPWLTGALVGLIVFLAPLVVLETLADDPPEIRLTPTGQRFSALVTSGDRSILVINSARPDETISALGRLRRPWEPKPGIIIAPATDNAAPGVIGAIRLLAPEHVIIAGLPGAAPGWSRVEQLCREQEIELEYLTDHLRIDAGSISLSILVSGSEPYGSSEVVIGRNGLQLAIGLGLDVPSTVAQVAVLNDKVPRASPHGPVIVQGTWAEQATGGESRLIVENQEVVTVLLEEGRLRIQGGRVISER